MSRETKQERVDKDLTIAFRAVFGGPGAERTKEQLLVLARLREIAKPGKPLFLPGQDPGALAFAQGRLRMWDEIAKRVHQRPTTVNELLGIPAEKQGDDDDE